MYDVLHGYKLKTENDAFGHFLITVSFQDVYFVEICRLANWEFLKFFFYYCFFLKCLFFFVVQRLFQCNIHRLRVETCGGKMRSRQSSPGETLHGDVGD